MVYYGLTTVRTILDGNLSDVWYLMHAMLQRLTHGHLFLSHNINDVLFAFICNEKDVKILEIEECIL